MATKKLYYVNQYQKEAAAVVQACTPTAKGFEVVLNQTIFYPTGGGQPCDLGTIDDVLVLDVREQTGEVIHLCSDALPVGKTVVLKIDWARRFMLMQQHSGEHIVSGIVHARFGYENVGFHMGSEVITIDFNGELSPEALREVEAAVNEAIYQNLPVEYLYPDAQALTAMSYRSKKELSGWVRIVKVGKTDLCACCGLHVAHTGEVGLVKLLSTTKFHSGSRIELLSGKRALNYVNQILDQNRKISGLLSAKPLATAAAVRRVSEELAAAQYHIVELENRIFSQKAAELAGKDTVLLFEDAMSPDALRRLTDMILQGCRGRCGVFSGEDGNYKYAIGQKDGDLRGFVKALNSELQGRGGGKPSFVQGSVAASREEIEAFFAKEN